MNRSTNYDFYLPSRDTDDIVDINQISENFSKIDGELSEMIKGKGVDQAYNPKSSNPQSGKAVAEATKDFVSLNDNTEWIFDGGDARGNVDIEIVVDGEMSDISNNPVANSVVKEYVDSTGNSLKQELSLEISNVSKKHNNDINDVNNRFSNIADYIVETGTNGIWTYRKWNSGIAECWGNVSIDTKINSVSSDIGEHFYYGGTFGTHEYPIAFLKAPFVQFTLIYSESNFIDARVRQYGDYITQTPEYWATAPWPKNAEISLTGSYYVIGRWK